jgi:hypothetical protein
MPSRLSEEFGYGLVDAARAVEKALGKVPQGVAPKREAA